jgi:hypothetical protein
MNRTLLSLAIIRTNWKLYKHDYIENFVPLFTGLIKSKGYEEINLEKLDIIKNDFKAEYGLVIPSNPIQIILNRLSKRRLIIREHDKFIPNYDKINSIDISTKSNQISREFEYVVSSLQVFVKEKHNIEVTQNEIEDALICYLKKHDLDLLFAAERNSLLPNINPNKKLQYLINEFIGNVFRKEPQLFQFILNLTIGHALSATILFEDFNQYSGKFHGLNLFLDTPFIFNLLGIHGILKKSLAEELISIINEEGASMFVLEITQREVNANLDEAFKLLEKGKTDPSKRSLTFKACIENGFNENDVEQIILNLPSFYKDHKIGYTDLPNYDDFRDYQIDEGKLYQTIVETYNEIVHFKKDETCKEPENKEKSKEDKINNTIYRDVQVLSGIYRYRLGSSPKTLKDCKYLFITTNSSLAHASRRFEKLEKKQRYSLPTCLTDIFLGTLIWLHSPAKFEAINEKKLIADSYAALEPDEKLIAYYLEDVEKLRKKGVISEENYILLRTHRAAINILENKTLGDISEFSSQTTEEILSELIAQLTAEERTKYMLEKETHEKTQSQLAEIQKRHSELLGANLLREQEESQAILLRNTRINKKSDIKARFWVYAIQTLLIAVFLISSLILLLNQFSNLKIARWVIIIIASITTITSVLNIITGFNIVSLREKLHYKLLIYFSNKYKKRIGEFN